uniref:Interaptin-like n=1 Tax=Saccoglossus kowalevskii TaxID=10224 RepID=A0ABM0MKQ3_SACKO|nr:PREDICTED: interaptin-like [Saccoglossus kowalevskii]
MTSTRTITEQDNSRVNRIANEMKTSTNPVCRLNRILSTGFDTGIQIRCANSNIYMTRGFSDQFINDFQEIDPSVFILDSDKELLAQYKELLKVYKNLRGKWSLNLPRATFNHCVYMLVLGGGFLMSSNQSCTKPLVAFDVKKEQIRVKKYFKAVCYGRMQSLPGDQSYNLIYDAENKIDVIRSYVKVRSDVHAFTAYSACNFINKQIDMLSTEDSEADDELTSSDIKKIEELVKQLGSLQDERLEISNENEQLKERVEVLSRDKNDQQVSREQLESEVSHSHSALETANKAMQEFVVRSQNTEQLNETLQQQLSETTVKLRERDEMLLNLNQQIENQQQLIAHQGSLRESYETECNHQQDTLTNYEKTIERLTNEQLIMTRRLDGEHLQAREKIKSLETANKELALRILQYETDVLQKELDSKQTIDSLDTTNRQLEREFNSLKTENQQFKSKLVSLETTNRELHERIKEREQQLEIEVNSCKELSVRNNDKQERQIKQLEGKVEEQNTLITTFNRNADIVTAEKESLQDRVAGLQEELRNSRSRLNDTGKRLTDDERKIKQIEVENASLRGKVEEQNTLITTLNRNADIMTVSVAKKDSRIQGLQERVAGLQEESSRSRLSNDDTGKQITDDESRMKKQLEVENASLRGKVEEQNTLITTLNRNADIMTVSVAKKDSRIQGLQERVAGLQEESRNMSRLNDTGKQLTDDESQMKQLEVENASLRGKVEEQNTRITTLNSNADIMTVSVAKKDSRIQGLQERVLVLENENETCKHRYDDEIRQLKRDLDKFQSTESREKRHEKAHELQTDTLRTLINKQNSVEIERLKKELDECRRKIENAKVNKNELCSQHDDLLKQNMELEKSKFEIEALRQSNMQLSDKLTSQKRAIEKYHDHILGNHRPNGGGDDDDDDDAVELLRETASKCARGTSSEVLKFYPVVIPHDVNGCTGTMFRIILLLSLTPNVQFVKRNEAMIPLCFFATPGVALKFDDGLAKYVIVIKKRESLTSLVECVRSILRHNVTNDTSQITVS